MQILITLMQIRIQFLFKVMGICEHWSIDPPGLHFNFLASLASFVSVHGHPRLYFEPLNLLNLNVDPDPGSKKMRIRIRNPGRTL
jgi:hypothetical protein